jgi:hypothetical protein
MYFCLATCIGLYRLDDVDFVWLVALKYVLEKYTQNKWSSFVYRCQISHGHKYEISSVIKNFN